MLKLRKLRHDDDEWKGRITYREMEIDLTAASEVEQEIRKGTYPVFIHLHLFGCQVKPCEERGVCLSMFPLSPFGAHLALLGTIHSFLSFLLIRPQLSRILSSFPSLRSVLLNRA